MDLKVQYISSETERLGKEDGAVHGHNVPHYNISVLIHEIQSFCCVVIGMWLIRKLDLNYDLEGSFSTITMLFAIVFLLAGCVAGSSRLLDSGYEKKEQIINVSVIYFTYFVIMGIYPFLFALLVVYI